MEESEDPMENLSRLEENMANLTSSINRLVIMLAGKGQQDQHEKKEPNGNEGSSSSANSSLKFNLEAKFEIQGDVNVERLDHWLKQLEVYFNIHGITEEQKISFARLKMGGHPLVWWESYVETLRLSKEELISSWEDFKRLLREQFYPLGHEAKQIIKWQFYRQGKGQSVQDYTTEFRK